MRTIDYIPKPPDYIGPLTGYRVWTTDHSGIIRSLFNGEVWEPYEPKVATCYTKGAIVLPHLLHPDHQPVMTCPCGIYAFSSLDGLIAELASDWQATQQLVFGVVALWGKAIEHERGFRAQFAYPIALGDRACATRYDVKYDDTLSAGHCLRSKYERLRYERLRYETREQMYRRRRSW